MKKKIFIICLLLLTFGCSSQYNLNIKDDRIEESIVSKISNDEIPASSNLKIMGDIEVDDQITPFIKNDQFPFINDETIKYDKSVKNKDGYTTVTLRHNYSFDDYKRSKAYNCFENKDFYEDNGFYNISLYGTFYCFHGDDITINVKTDFKVVNNNADIVDNNVYTWVIDEESHTNKEIILKMKKPLLSNSGIKKTIFNSPIVAVIIILLLFVIIVSSAVYFVRRKNAENNKI